MGKFKGDDRNRVHELGAIAYYLAGVQGVFQTDVIISAHGGIKSSAQADLTVPAGLKLLYYVDHGVNLEDPGVSAFSGALGKPQYKQENIAGSDTYNYNLSKYQGKHGNVKETYQSILKDGTETQAFLDQMRTRYGDNIPDRFANASNFDVVTIRARHWTNGSDLKSILKLIKKLRGQAGGTIHCSFCRGFY